MPQWTDFLDLNLLRPSTFERRHQQDYRGHRPTASTTSLPSSLPSRQSTYSAPPAPDRPPSGYLGFHSRRQHSLDVRPRPVFTGAAPPSSTNTAPSQLLETRGRHSSPPGSRSASHPRPVSTASTTPTTALTSGFGLFASRLRSLNSSSSEGNHPDRGGSLEIPRSQLPPSSTSHDTYAQPSRRPYFFRGSSWSGHAHRHHASQSSQGSSTIPPPVPEVPAFLLARPTAGLDMTPRTVRMRRIPVDEYQQLSRADDDDTDYPLTSEVAITIPPLAVIQPTGMPTIHSNSSQDDIDREGSRAHTPTTAAAATTTTTLPRVSISESRDNETTGLFIQRPLTAAQRRILAQRAYLKKFMCIVATMPLLATLAVYNKLEVVMWWVIAVPLVGITVALIWRRKLGQKLQRLDEENSQLSLPLDRGSATRETRTRNPEEEGEASPPPDYQASIITPPAYIVAPRKVPSYRSLENLFAFARTRSQRLAQTAAAAVAGNSNDAARDAATAASQLQSREIRLPQHEESTMETLPEMREVGCGFSECTMQVLDSISPAGDMENPPQRPSGSMEDVEGLAAAIQGKEVGHEHGSRDALATGLVSIISTVSGPSSSSGPSHDNNAAASASLQTDIKGKAPSRE